MWKLTVSATQYLGLFNSLDWLAKESRGTSRTGTARMITALKHGVTFSRNGHRYMGPRVEFALEKSKVLRDRSQNFDREARANLKKIGEFRLGDRVIPDKVRRSFYTFIGLADTHVSVLTWIAAYELGLEKVDSDAQAVDYADKAIRALLTAPELGRRAAAVTGGRMVQIWASQFDT